MLAGIADALPAIGLLLVVLGYATALTFGNTEHAKAAFLQALLEGVGEMPDPFYGQ